MYRAVITEAEVKLLSIYVCAYCNLLLLLFVILDDSCSVPTNHTRKHLK